MSTISEILSELDLTLFEYLESIDLPNISQNLATIRENINTLSSQMTIISQNVSLNNSKITELFALDQNTQQQLELIKELVKLTDEQIDELTAITDLLQTRVTQLESDVTLIPALELSVTQIQVQITKLESDVSVIPDLQTSVTQIRSTVNSQTAYIVELQQQSRKIQEDIQGLKDQQAAMLYDINQALDLSNNNAMKYNQFLTVSSTLSGYTYVAYASSRPFIYYHFLLFTPAVGYEITCYEGVLNSTPQPATITIYMYSNNSSLVPPERVPIICGAPYKIKGSNILQITDTVVFYPYRPY